MALEAIALATLAVIVPVLVGVLIALRRRQPLQKAKQLEALVPRIDPEKRAERQARRKARTERFRAGVTEVAEGVRDGLDNIDDEERAEILAELEEAKVSVVEAFSALVSAIASKTPAAVVVAVKEGYEALRDAKEVCDLVQAARAD